MQPDNIKQFIEFWHRSVLIDKHLETVEFANNMVKKLVEKINSNEPIKKLASNPLLCAMICALNYTTDSLLPTGKPELYEECCKMLIENRDVRRNISFDINGINLTYKQKRSILDDIAYWMLKNGDVETNLMKVIERCEQKLVSFNIKNLKASDVIQNLIERSGVVRLPDEGTFDFIHKTFQEYMAAAEASKQNDWGLLATIEFNS
jgi:predicted NACHT family NTPase